MTSTGRTCVCVCVRERSTTTCVITFADTMLLLYEHKLDDDDGDDVGEIRVARRETAGTRNSLYGEDHYNR